MPKSKKRKDKRGKPVKHTPPGARAWTARWGYSDSGSFTNLVVHSSDVLTWALRIALCRHRTPGRLRCRLWTRWNSAGRLSLAPWRPLPTSPRR
jgi:hypothetical protein